VAIAILNYILTSRIAGTEGHKPKKRKRVKANATALAEELAA
jgi:hypothetical protein